MGRAHSGAPRLILFGAFDRHNFGDLLLAHCAAAGDPREPVFTGLVERDLSSYGGHRVIPLAQAIAQYGAESAELVVVGGEILTTTAWEAAVMLQSPTAAAKAIRLHDPNESAREDWSRHTLGNRRPLPYVPCADDLPKHWRVEFRAVGGVDLESLPPATRGYALKALSAAQRISVRDAVTQAALSRHGLHAPLILDPASDSALLFGPRIAERLGLGELAELRRQFPRWIAVQVAAHLGDDATLTHVASRTAPIARRAACPIVLFRAGIAPWHDDIETLERLAQHLRSQAPEVPVTVFGSAHVFDICALLADAHGYVGTSLHGWIVANSFGVPGVCLVRHPGDKAAVYLDTWHPEVRAWRLPDEETLIP